MDASKITLAAGLIVMAIGFLGLYAATRREQRAKRMLAEQLEVHRASAMLVHRTEMLKTDITNMRNAFGHDLTALSELRAMQPVLIGDWHHGQGNIVSGTVRIAHEDFDTNPADEFRTEFWNWVCGTMNVAIKLQREDRLRKATELITGVKHESKTSA
jgi:hypothetical protein